MKKSKNQCNFEQYTPNRMTKKKLNRINWWKEWGIQLLTALFAFIAAIATIIQIFLR